MAGWGIFLAPHSEFTHELDTQVSWFLYSSLPTSKAENGPIKEIKAIILLSFFKRLI